MGYGGTKKEMERLIIDASKMTDVQKKLGITVDATSDSFSNIINAISVVQYSLGITGTTAKEASTTISGSVNAMKSAWENLLVGVSDDTQDFGALVDNFVESIVGQNGVGGVVNNILPRVQTAISGIGTLVSGLLTTLVPQLIDMVPPLIEQSFPVIISALETAISGISSVLPKITTVLIGLLPQAVETGFSIINGLISGVSSALPELIPTIMTIIPTIIDTLTENTPMLFSALITMAETLTKSLIDNLPTFIDQLLTSLDMFADMLGENLDTIIEAGIQVLLALVRGVTEALPTLIERVPEIVSKFADLINDNAPTILQAGIQILLELIKGIIQAIPTLKKNITQIFTAIWKVWQSIQWIKLGKLIINGLKKGITAMLGSLKNSTGSIVDKIKSGLSALKDKGLEWGKDMLQGFIDGIKNKIANLGSAITDVAKTISSKLHFSVPDEGPLADADTWMPDMIDLMVNGIKTNKYKLENQITGLASTINDDMGFDEFGGSGNNPQTEFVFRYDDNGNELYRFLFSKMKIVAQEVGT